MRRFISSLAALAALAATAGAHAGEAQLDHHPPALIAGSDLIIDAKLLGATNADPHVFWRRAGDLTYQSESMTPMHGGYRAIIRAHQIHSDIEYYLESYYGPWLDKQVFWMSASDPMLLKLRPAIVASAKPTPAPGAAVIARVPAKAAQRSALPFAVAGAGIVASGLATVLGLEVRSATNELSSATTASSYVDQLGRANSLAKAATFTWIAAAVLGAAGIGLYVAHL